MDKVGYVRVSTNDQNVKNQCLILEGAGIPRDLIFVDKGISGTVPPHKRPGFKAMLEYIKSNGQIRFVYVFELSRLGRTLIETLTTIEDLEARGILVWSLSPNEGFTRSDDKSIRSLLISILSWVAQRERENLVERTKAGLDRARSEGKTLGRPRRPIEWSKVEALRSAGASWAEVSRALEIPTMTLYRRRKLAGRD